MTNKELQIDFCNNIQSVNTQLKGKIQNKVNLKTKPLGSLGHLEDLAIQISCILNTINPEIKNPSMLIFAGDHGIADEGVSAYPKVVTHQMVLNFLAGGAAINVFCKQHGLDLQIVDAGVDFEFEPNEKLIDSKIGRGTASFLHQAAMSNTEAKVSLRSGAKIVEKIKNQDCNLIAFGEMGIGNTSSAAILLSLLCNIPLENLIGKGTGLDTIKLKHKTEILQIALLKSNLSSKDNIIDIISYFGGFEILQISGAMLKAAEQKMIILIDGFIATAAWVIALKIAPQVKDYGIFCHLSDEKGHQLVCEHLQVRPLLHLSLRLGEGSGAALAFPLIQSAVLFLKEMASFEEANVDSKEKNNLQ